LFLGALRITKTCDLEPSLPHTKLTCVCSQGKAVEGAGYKLSNAYGTRA
jgi:hypothetical protein